MRYWDCLPKCELHITLFMKSLVAKTEQNRESQPMHLISCEKKLLMILEGRIKSIYCVIWLCDWLGWVKVLCKLVMCDLLDVDIELCGVLLT